MRHDYSPGIRIALDHDLTKAEMKVLFPLLNASMTKERLIKFINRENGGLQRVLTSLTKKGLVVTKQEEGTTMYSFNRERYP